MTTRARDMTPAQKADAMKGFWQLCGVLAVIGAISSIGHKSPADEMKEQYPGAAGEVIAKCYSAWNHGAPQGLKDAVAANLRDPNSFEITKASYRKLPEADGSVWFSVNYRAKNGFGGMDLSSLSGQVHPDCRLSNIEFAPK